VRKNKEKEEGESDSDLGRVRLDGWDSGACAGEDNDEVVQRTSGGTGW
jgi:hypothetical protein